MLWQFAPTKKFDAADFARLPGAAAGQVRRARAAPHGRGAPSHVLTPDFTKLLREHSVAVIFAEHETYPAIPDVTADFVYARLQKGKDTEKAGYPPKALDRLGQARADLGRRAACRPI